MQITIVFLVSHLELIILINGSTMYMRLGFIQFCLEKQTQILSLEINLSIFCRMPFIHSDSMIREYIGITICMHHCS